MKTFQEILEIETNAAHYALEKIVMYLCSNNDGLVYMQRGEADGVVDWAVRSDGAIIGGGDYASPIEIPGDVSPASFDSEFGTYRGQIKHMPMGDLVAMIEMNKTPEQLAENRRDAYASFQECVGINLDEWVNQGLNNIGLGECPF